MRLDKYLSQSGEYSRSEAGKLIRSGAVRVNGEPVRKPDTQIGPDAQVVLAGEVIGDNSLQYYLLHKPAGVLTAARDSRAQTVMDLVPENLRKRKVQPVGRLDKDTTGLLLLTNDGELAHFLLSPNRHVWKQYRATVTGQLTCADAEAFANGLPLSDFVTKPAKLTIVSSTPEESVGLVEVREGKFHQVKRMFAATGHEVTALHRHRFGPLTLPDDLPVGQCRPLTEDEIQALRQSVQTRKTDGTETGLSEGKG
ncbi:MAG: rRNA pseudouridine synthase [Clostridiales bacterium]|nr:rRNA pseudouridine synthase [Clostridiales bacterium]